MTLYLLKCELCEKEIMLDIWTTYDLHCPICERGLLHYSGMKAGARSFRELLEDRDESELIEANLKEITAKLESAPSISRTLLNKNDMLKDIVKHAPAIAESLKNAPTTPAPTITPPGAPALPEGSPLIAQGKYKGRPALIDPDPAMTPEKLARARENMIKEIKEIRARGFSVTHTNARINAIGRAYHVMSGGELLPGFLLNRSGKVQQKKHCKKYGKQPTEKCKNCGRDISKRFMSLHLKKCLKENPAPKTPIGFAEEIAKTVLSKRDAERITHS